MENTSTKRLSNHLLKYSALSVAIAGVADINGQVIYTPNINIGGPGITYPIDLNGDTFNDAILRHRAGIGGILDVAPASGSGAIRGNGNYSGTVLYPLALNYGDPIGFSNTDWNSYSIYQLMDSKGNCNPPGYNSLWCDATDKYLGLRFHIGIDTHYGWARLTVDDTPDVGWILKDYAYQFTRDTPLFAGEGGSLGINDNAFSKIKIVSLNKSIALYNLPQTTQYRLISLAGQSVLDGKIDTQTYVIEANHIANGVYIVELKDSNSNAVIRKKVVL